MLKLIKASLVGLVMAVIASASVIFASSNTNATSLAGEGADSISGFVVSGVVYRQAADPTRLEAVEFDLDQAAGTVLVKLVSNDSHYTACQNTGGFHWNCLLPATLPLASLDELRILALGE